MTVELDSKAELYPKIAAMADHGGPGRNVRGWANQIEHNAHMILSQIRRTTEWEKLEPPMVSRRQASGVTAIGLDSVPGEGWGVTDYIVWMEGGEDNRAAMAMEMGHAPSGYFKGTATQAPRGLYILHRAAGLTFFKKFRR